MGFKLFDKERFKGRMKLLLIALLLFAWTVLHIWLLNEYNEGAEDMSNWIKLFIMHHIIWWHIAPFVYGIGGLVVLSFAAFKPRVLND